MASAKNLELNIIASALYLLLYLIVSAHAGVLLNLDKVSVYYLDPLNFRCF